MNGNGGNGKCAGCTGKADDKSPGGQYPGDHNNGYECDHNNGVGKGNPAHSKCGGTPPPDCHTTNTCPPPPCQTNCTQPDCDNDGIPDAQDPDDCNPPPPCQQNCTPPDCDNDGIPDAQDPDDCNPPPPCQQNCNPPDCDNDGVPDAQDPDDCTPPPPPDCDGDGMPDSVDADNSSCNPPPPDDVCPNVEGMQTEVPPDLVLGSNGNCVPPDEVLGEIIHRGNPGPDVLPSRQQRGAPLPFTGANGLLPIAIVALALLLAGGILVSRKQGTEQED
jgi:hypothetical protein